MANAGISQAMLSELTAKQRKALFVRIGFQGEPGSIRQIPRFRLNPLNVNRVFNCDVEFLQEDATGNIIWPKNWATDCLPPPYLYFIREKVWPELAPDVMEQDEYRGKSLVIVDNVPEEVTPKILVAWMNAGLDDDDPDLASAKIQLEEMQDNLAKVEKQIAELPSMKVQGSNAKEELETKKKRAQTLNMQKIDLEEDIRAVKEKFDKLRRDREAMIDSAFQVKLAETKQPMGLNVWEARFSRDKKGQRMAYIAVHKFNWSEFRVAYHRYNGSIITGKNDLVGLTGEYQEINMRNVTVSRRRHGVGMYKYNDERGFYSGEYRHGLRHGMGTEINQQGRFQGKFERDWRRGPGSQVYANGDVYRGPYGGSRYHNRESLIFGDEYTDGLPHGNGKIRFVDGSVYEGEWKDGVPSGKGKYVASVGIVMEGTFGRWATLHGYGSYTIDDVTRIGTWREGLLHGKGTEIDMQEGIYEGDWRHGEKHGYGTLNSKLVQGLYSGWYHHGYRYGRGILNYGNIDRDRQKEEDRMKKIAESMRAKSVSVGLPEGSEDSEGNVILNTDTIQESSDTKLLLDNNGNSSADTKTLISKALGTTNLNTVDEELDDDDDENTEGTEKKKDEKHQTEYEKMQGELVQFIPYRGDYCYEGRWRAGSVRTNGVFTKRFGRPEPNLHVLKFVHNGINPDLPLLVELAAQEEEIARKRSQFAKATLKETIEKRIIKEGENLSSFVYWKRTAETNQKDIKYRTRRGKAQLEEIKAAIKKPERAAGTEEEQDHYSDDSYNSSDEDEERVADNDDQDLMV